jgi:hypothetical protein
MSRSNNERLSAGFAQRDQTTIFRIIRAMNDCAGSLEQTARKLNIDKWTLLRWIQKEPRLAEAYKDARVIALGGKPDGMVDIMHEALRRIAAGDRGAQEIARRALRAARKASPE